MDVRQGKENVEFNEQDESRIQSLLPFIKEHSGRIIDESYSVLSRDQRVVDLLRRNNLEPADARLVWKNSLELLFSKPMTDETIEKLRRVGVVHTDKGVSENFAITGASLFMLKTIEHIKTNMDVDIDHLLSVIKLFSLVTFVIIVSYVKESNERRRGILNSLGISDALLDRLAELGRS